MLLHTSSLGSPGSHTFGTPSGLQAGTIVKHSPSPQLIVDGSAGSQWLGVPPPDELVVAEPPPMGSSKPMSLVEPVAQAVANITAPTRTAGAARDRKKKDTAR